MPAVSKSQRRFMAACMHGATMDKKCPDMPKSEMRKFAATPEKGLPKRKRKRMKFGAK